MAKILKKYKKTNQKNKKISYIVKFLIKKREVNIKKFHEKLLIIFSKISWKFRFCFYVKLKFFACITIFNFAIYII